MRKRFIVGLGFIITAAPLLAVAVMLALLHWWEQPEEGSLAQSGWLKDIAHTPREAYAARELLAEPALPRQIALRPDPTRLPRLSARPGAQKPVLRGGAGDEALEASPVAGVAGALLDFYDPRSESPLTSAGLHVFVLMPEKGPRAERFLLDLMTVMAPSSELARVSGVAGPNIFHLPLRAGGTVDTQSAEAVSQAIKAYDYDWARTRVETLCARHHGLSLEAPREPACRPDLFAGPFLVTIAGDLEAPTALDDLPAPQALLSDLGPLGEAALLPVVLAHKAHPRRLDLSARDELETFRFTLLNLKARLLEEGGVNPNWTQRRHPFATLQTFVTLQASDVKS